MNIKDENLLRIYLTEWAPKWLVSVLLWMARRHVKEERSFIYKAGRVKEV
jgi:hypothetical protein